MNKTRIFGMKNISQLGFPFQGNFDVFSKMVDFTLKIQKWRNLPISVIYSFKIGSLQI